MFNLTIHNPYDSFFKYILSNLTVAKDFIQAHFEPAITKRLLWKTLRLSNKSYIDEQAQASTQRHGLYLPSRQKGSACLHPDSALEQARSVFVTALPSVQCSHTDRALRTA
jgi:Putative transposase, YhgA-like